MEGAKVKNVTAVDISDGKGFTSKVYKVAIEFDDIKSLRNSMFVFMFVFICVRYGAGYTLLVRLQDVDASEKVKSEILRRFPGSMLKEEHVLQLNFELRKTDSVTWSTLFAQMEQIVEPLRIADYSLSQTTLEQVFLEFSRDAGAVSD
ncbi:hypothetical protein QR680_014990 [Steinernema hermaphroditum]|uniref:ABCA1-4-like C-terminal R2 regulatory domain-containing protein n=1 Tax=Steinernema hermaphroditum TaxID=289476 RepID=A0AA39IAQ1_9BILA|nr:hypothetical protein QR680_014990 [Steinernema hermaphroditum]